MVHVIGLGGAGARVLLTSLAIAGCSTSPISSSPTNPAGRAQGAPVSSPADPLASQPSVKWRARIGTSGVGTRSVAVAGPLVFASSDDNHVYALSRDSGKTIWGQAPAGEQYLGSPVTDGKVLYVAGTKGVHALDADSGHPIWTFTLEEFGGGPLILTRGHLIVGAQQGLAVYALNASTGHLEWSWKASHGSPDTLRVVGKTAIVSEADGTVDALDSQSGEVRWVSSPPAKSSRTLLAASPSTVVLSAEPTNLQPSGGDISPYVSLVGLDASNGNTQWSVPGVNSSGAVLTDKVLVTGTGNGKPGAFPVRGVDPGTGRTLWELLASQQLPEMSTDGHRVYAWSTINSRTTDLLAIDPASGQQRWELRDVQQSDPGGGGNSEVKIDGGMMFATDDWGEVVALQPAS
jgi:outer membrane protein assembly factor BamB